MADAFRKMFWGYLFIVLEIHIFIDLLADPIGYWLLFSGISTLAKDFPIANKAKILSLALLLFSIPTVLIQGESSQPALFTGWTVYFNSIHLLNVVLVFYMCRLLMEIAKHHEDKLLVKSTYKTSMSYIVVMLLGELFSSFAINLSNTNFTGIIWVAIFASLLMHILFLSLLHQYKKRFHEVSKFL